MSTHSISASQFKTGLRLLATVPPVGIAWLIYLSRWQWLKLLRHPHRVHRDPVLGFILLLLTATLMNLNHHDCHGVLLSTLMLVVLLNLWLLCRYSTHLLTLHDSCQLIVQFGLYITISGNLFHWLNHWWVLPTWIKFLLGDLLWGYAANQNRLFGSAYNPNDACCLLLIAFGLVLAQLIDRDRQIMISSPTWTLGLTGVVLALGIYQTRSRTGLAIMFAMLITVAYQRSPHHRGWLGSGLIVSGLLLWATLPRTATVSAAWTTRLSIWRNSFNLFRQAPLLGVTYYGFAPSYLALTGTAVPHAHDVLLMILASFGLIGGVGFAYLVAQSGWRLTHNWHVHHDPQLRYFLMTLPIVFAYGLTDFIFSSFQVLIIVLLLAAYWQREQLSNRQIPVLQQLPLKQMTNKK